MTQIPNDPTANNGRIICVERDPVNSFIKLASNMNADGSCIAGTIACGGEDNANSFYLKICVPGTTCPVQRILINDAYVNSTNVYIDKGTITSGLTNKLWLTRTGNNAPLSELVASIDNVCTFDADKNHYGGNTGSTV